MKTYKLKPLPVFSRCPDPPTSCKDLVLYIHDSHPPETGETMMTADDKLNLGPKILGKTKWYLISKL